MLVYIAPAVPLHCCLCIVLTAADHAYIKLTVRLHMGVIFDPSVRYSTIAPVLDDTVLSALMTL